MKRSNFVSIAFIAVLMVLVVSCTPLQESTGGYEEAPRNSRVYRSAPYGNRDVIVVERDPFTGQYYQVSPFGYYNGSPFNANPFGYRYGYPSYPSGGYYRGGNRGVTNRPVQRQQQQPQASRQSSPTTQKAKDIIRGN